jgi:MoaA/NifB/PqqE/SkfB family radical SAM enzyme
LADLKRLERRLIPAVCDVSVTNVCNATCDFCSYAHDKGLVHDRRWVGRAALGRALPILHRRGVRYLNFQGGEPLLHPAIDGLVADAHAIGMKPALITNGWQLPDKIDRLADAGLGTLLVSIDSHSMAEHEHNRGLRGVGERIRAGIDKARRHRIPAIASVTVNRLIDYDALPSTLADLGFDAVSFSYPRRKPFGSSSLVYSEDSKLVDFDESELIQALQAIRGVKRKFPVLNPDASIMDIQNHVRGREESFSCVGGHKYFYLDWNLDIWRCEAWSKSLGSVFDLDSIPDQRDRCTDCMMSCYRDTSVMMHAGIAATDAATALGDGKIGSAAGLLFRRTVALSLWSVLAEARVIARLARHNGKRSARISQAERNQTPAMRMVGR